MATYHAVAAVGEAIRRLLEDACPRGEFPAAQFALIQAGDLQTAPMKEGVSLFLYRVAVNGAGRNRAAREISMSDFMSHSPDVGRRRRRLSFGAEVTAARGKG